MNFKCPQCGATMETLGFSVVKWPAVRVAKEDADANLRICPACRLVQWDDGGKTQTRYPRPVKVTGEER